MYKNSSQKVKVFMIKMFTKTRRSYRSFSSTVVLRSCVAVTVPHSMWYCNGHTEYVSNEVSLQFYGKQTLMWVFSCEFVAYFWKAFLQEHIWGLHLIIGVKLSYRTWKLNCKLILFSLRVFIEIALF